MTNPLIDSFGQEVNVGDYVYFRTKTRYASAALSIGRVEKIGKTGHMSLTAINTYGKTIERYTEETVAYGEKVIQSFKAKGEEPPKWALESGRITFTQRIADASSCVVIPTHVLPPRLIEAFNQ